MKQLFGMKNYKMTHVQHICSKLLNFLSISSVVKKDLLKEKINNTEIAHHIYLVRSKLGYGTIVSFSKNTCSG